MKFIRLFCCYITMIFARCLPVLILIAFFANLVVAQDADEIRPGDGRLDFDSSTHDHRGLHRTSYLLERPEIKEAYEEALSRFGDPDFHATAMERVQEYEVGDRRNFYVINFEESSGSSDEYDDIEFELRGKSEHVRVWVEKDEIGSNKVSESVVDGFMEVLVESTPSRSVDPDRGLYELNRDLFGNYPNVDGSNTLNVLITDIQEESRDDERNLVTLGFFNPIDLNPDRSNSNGADIIYINSNPFIYGGSFSRSNWHSTLSHEIQHLIHARYGNLNTFQNEGQSEMAEIITGFSPRPMTFLSQPDERTGMVNARRTRGLFRWRQGEDEVLQDYERAGLLHSYIAEQVGAEQAGRITRASSSGTSAYRSVLEDNDLEWEETLVNFHISNLINREFEGNTAFRYSIHPSLANLRVRNFSRVYTAARPPYVQNREVEVQFGGAKYTRWVDVGDLNLTLDSGRGVRHKAWYRKGDQENFRLEELDSGSHTFNGEIDQFTLITMNTDPGGSESQPSPRSFTYTGDWQTGDSQISELNYAANDTLAFLSLPSGDGVRVVGQRITSPLNGEIQDLSFRVRRHDDALRGEGTLQVAFHDSEELGTLDGDPFYAPPDVDDPIDQTEIDLSELGEGVNSVDLEDHHWEVEKDTDYIITYRVEPESDDARIQLMADAGQNEELLADEETRDFYRPARTIILIEEDDSLNWATYVRRNNLDQTVEILGVDPDFEPDFPDPPVADEFQLDQNYPNPFNPSTNIRYNLNMEIDVVLEVYDLTGRKITTLVDERQEAGRYTVPFDATDYGLASGMYLYRLQVGSFSDTRKMLFVK